MKEILEYQQLDIELTRLNKASNENLDNSNMDKYKALIKEASDKSKMLESTAEKMLSEYVKMKDVYEKTYKKVQALSSKSLDSIDGGDFNDILSQTNSLSQELFNLERGLNLFITKIKKILKEFEDTKNAMISAKAKFAEAKNKYESGIAVIAPKKKAIIEKMKEMEKTIDSTLLTKYKNMKGDKIFPVFTSLNNGHCSGCRVEIPTSKINKLKSEGTIVCEQCHRIIYN